MNWEKRLRYVFIDSRIERALHNCLHFRLIWPACADTYVLVSWTHEYFCWYQMLLIMFLEIIEFQSEMTLEKVWLIFNRKPPDLLTAKRPYIRPLVYQHRGPPQAWLNSIEFVACRGISAHLLARTCCLMLIRSIRRPRGKFITQGNKIKLLHRFGKPQMRRQYVLLSKVL